MELIRYACSLEMTPSHMCVKMVVTRGVEAMEQVLSWDRVRTSKLLQDCEAELTRRLQQVQALQSIRSQQSVEKNS